MVIFASEDIGLAGNGALSLATACFQAVERVGMPESGLILAHTCVAAAGQHNTGYIFDFHASVFLSFNKISFFMLHFL